MLVVQVCQLRSPLILLFFLLPTLSRAVDFDFTPTLQRAYADIIQLKVQQGREMLVAELNQGNGIAFYVDDFADMVTLLVSDDRTAYKQLASRQEQRLAQIDDLDDQSPWKRFTQAEVRLHGAFVKLKFGQEVSACWDIIRAYRLLEENHQKFPSFLPTQKSLGVLHVLIGSVPEKYTWVTNLLGLRGDVKKGVHEIQLVAQYDSLFGTEARLINLLLKAYVLKFTSSDLETLHQFVQEQPGNLLLHFFATTILMKEARSEEALAYLQSRPTGPLYLPFPIIDYLKADIYFQKGDYVRAERQYAFFLSQYKGTNFLKDTYYKRFLAFWLLNDDNHAFPLLRKVLQVGETVVESDKAAQKFAEAYRRQGISSKQKILLRARFATDGGYLDTALSVLRPYSEVTFDLLSEKAEFNYRRGRIYQRKNETETAIPFFERAILLSESDQLSFGATSALQLGYIYQQKQNIIKARVYFRKALSYKKHEYKNSIDNKARAALNELRE